MAMTASLLFKAIAPASVWRIFCGWEWKRGDRYGDISVSRRETMAGSIEMGKRDDSRWAVFEM